MTPTASPHGPPPTAAVTWGTYLRDAPADTFDCAMRQAAYAYGQKLLPRQGTFESLFYALNLNDPACPTQLVTPKPPRTVAPALPNHAIFVSPTGDDAGSGRIDAPLRSIQKAVDLAAASGPASSPTVVLRGGTHFLPEQVLLTAKHSGLRLMSHPGEKAAISGGVPLKVAWSPYKVGSGLNIWVADISGQVTDVPGLQINGARATRARYPNLPAGIEASCGYGCMVSSHDAVWTVSTA